MQSRSDGILTSLQETPLLRAICNSSVTEFESNMEKVQQLLCHLVDLTGIDAVLAPNAQGFSTFYVCAHMFDVFETVTLHIVSSWPDQNYLDSLQVSPRENTRRRVRNYPPDPNFWVAMIRWGILSLELVESLPYIDHNHLEKIRERGLQMRRKSALSVCEADELTNM